ncbi:MAG: hypothetical protein Q8N60_03905, partial [Candidatus Diapherotrites archaeon]|nr:hypothetical protein [Candidatus Diapherotrites archaeon]
GFRFGNIYLAKEFRGCGKYYVEIKGAVSASQGEISIDESGRNFAIAINMKQDRADTDQCLHRIENAANFLPVDEGYTLTTDTTAWPGFVQGSTEQFGELPKMFAAQLFKNPEGRYSASITKSNRLVLVKGNTGQGLLKIRIEKSGSPDAPKTVYAHVPDNFNAADKEMATSIANALGTFKAYAFSESDCWGEDETGQYIVMKSSKDMEKWVGKLVLDGEKAIKINSQEQCIDFNLTTGAREDIQFETDFGEKTKAGIEYVAIYLKGKSEKEKSAVLLKESANGKSEKTILKKDQLKETTEEKEGKKQTKFKAEAQFCVKGDSTFSLAVENIKEIKITASGNATPGRKSEQFAVSIEACGIHPYDLVKQMGNVTPEDIEKAPDKKIIAFATVGWKGAPSEIDIIAVQRAISAEAARVEAEKRYGSGAGTPTAQQPAYMQEIAERKLAGIWTAYFLPCAATSAVYGAIMHFGWGALWDVSLDCTLPAMWSSWDAVKDLGGIGKTMLEGIEGFVKRVIPFFGEWIVGQKETGVPLEAEAQTAAESFSENILPMAAFGVSADSIRLAVTKGGAVITQSSADTAGAQVSEAVFKRLRATTFKKSLADDATKVAVEEMLTDAQTKYAKQIASKIVSAKALDPKKIKFIDHTIVDSSKKAFGEMGEEINNKIVQLGLNGKLGGEPGKMFDSVRKSSLDNMFDEAKVVEHGKLGITAGDLELPGKATAYTKKAREELRDNVVKKMKGNILSEIQDQSPALKKAMEETGFRNSVGGRIESILKESLEAQPLYDGKPLASRGKFLTVKDYSVKIAQSDLDNAARNTVVRLKRELGNDLVEKAIGKKVGKEFAEKILMGDPESGIIGMSDDIIDPKIGATRLSKLKTNLKQANRFLTLGTVGNVIKNMAKGIAGGVLANYMGYQGWKYYWDKFGTAPVPGAETISGDAPKIDRDGDGRFNEDPIDGKDNDGDGLIDEDYPLLFSQQLRNGGTYMIVVSKDNWGAKNFNFVALQED